MKKAEEYLGYKGNISFCTIEENADLDEEKNLYYNHKDLLIVIKKVQEDAIRETVKECAERAEIRITDNNLIEEGYLTSYHDDGCFTYIVSRQSILSVADKLIKKL